MSTSTVDLLEIAQVLDDAADLLAARGWTTESYEVLAEDMVLDERRWQLPDQPPNTGDPTGCLCTSGALAAVVYRSFGLDFMHDSSDSDPWMEANQRWASIEAYVALELGDDRSNNRMMVGWNDDATPGGCAGLLDAEMVLRRRAQAARAEAAEMVLR